MPLLLTCPTEILVLIASYLPVLDRTSLVRVCKTLHQVAEPTLYHEISMEWIEGYHDNEASVYRAPVEPRIHLFLHRILVCPRLATLVKVVRFSGTKYHSHTGRAATSELSVDDSKQFTDLVNSSGLAASYRTFEINGRATVDGEEQPWVRDIMEGDVDLYQALALSQLPNINYLHIGLDQSEGFRYISATLRCALCSNTESPKCSSFRSLFRVDLYADMFDRDLAELYLQCEGLDIAITEVLPFFYLPSLREFRVAMPETLNFSWPTIPPCASALKILRLQRSHVKANVLEQLLAVTPYLEILEYDFCCLSTTSNARSPTFLISADLDRALAHVKATLKILRIAVHFYFHSGGTYYDDSNPIAGIDGILHSLKDLQSLIEAELPFALILGQSSQAHSLALPGMPPCLESLIFRDDMALYRFYPWRSGRFLNHLPACISFWSAQNVNIATLGLSLNESQDNWDERAMTKFSTLCQSMHIAPRIHTCSGVPVFASDRFR
jgi:hypothetical protein